MAKVASSDSRMSKAICRVVRQFSAVVLGLTSVTALGEGTCYTTTGEHGRHFSSSSTWTCGSVPQADDNDQKLSFQPVSDGLMFIDDLSYVLPVRQMEFSGQGCDGLGRVCLVGHAIALGQDGSVSTNILVRRDAGRPGFAVEIRNDLTAFGVSTFLDPEEGNTLVLEGTLAHGHSGNGISDAAFKFVGAGTNVIAGSYSVPNGETWNANADFGGNMTRISGDVAVPGFYLRAVAGIGTSHLCIEKGGRLRTLSNSSSVSGGSLLDVCGGILDQQSSNKELLIKSATLRIRDGGIVRLGQNAKVGREGTSEIEVLSGGTLYLENAHYLGGTHAGTVHYIVNGGTLVANTAHGLCLGSSSGTAVSGTNYLHLAKGGTLYAARLSQGYRYGEANRDRDVFLYADGGEIVYSSNGEIISPQGESSFIDDTFASSTACRGRLNRFRTIVREGGLVFNTVRSPVVYNGSIEGNDKGGSDGGLVKLGGARLKLTGVCTYTGTNDVRRGELLIAAANAATNTHVSSIGTLSLADPAYYGNGITLERGANLVLSGSGAYSFSSLTAARDAIIVLSPAAVSVSVTSAPSLEGNLLFRLTDSAIGSYQVLTVPNAAAVVEKCRVLESEPGKSYVFSFAGNTVTLTISAKQASTWALEKGGNWNVADNWDVTTVPNASGAQAVLGPSITEKSTLSVNPAIVLGGLYAQRPAEQYVVSGSAVTFESDDSALPHVGLAFNGDPYFYFTSASSLADSLSLRVENSRAYLQGAITSSGQSPTLLMRNADSAWVYFSPTIDVPTVFDGGMLYNHGGNSSRFSGGFYLRGGTVAHYAKATDHRFAAAFVMSESSGFNQIYDNCTNSFSSPVGTLFLRNACSSKYVQNFRATSFERLESVMLQRATFISDVPLAAELPRLQLTSTGIDASHPSLNTVARARNSGNLTVDGSKVFRTPTTDTYKTNILHIAGDTTGKIILKGGFSSALATANALSLDSGYFDFGEGFCYDAPFNFTSDLTIGSSGVETVVAFSDDSFIRVNSGRIRGDTTLDLSAGGRIRAKGFAFAGTLKLKAVTDAYARGQIFVETPTFSTDGVFDVSSMLQKSIKCVPLLRFGTLSQADESNLRSWSIVGVPEDSHYELEIDRDAGVVQLRRHLGVCIIVR